MIRRKPVVSERTPVVSERLFHLSRTDKSDSHLREPQPDEQASPILFSTGLTFAYRHYDRMAKGRVPVLRLTHDQEGDIQR